MTTQIMNSEQTYDPCQSNSNSNSTPITPDSPPSSGNTPQSPVSPPPLTPLPPPHNNPNNTSFATKLIPASMISMNKTSIPLPPTKPTKNNTNYPSAKMNKSHHSDSRQSRSRSRSRSRERNSKNKKCKAKRHCTHNHNQKDNVCMDLTMTTTPISPDSDSSESDIQIIGARMNPSTSTHSQSQSRSRVAATNQIINKSSDISFCDNYNFERYTLDGIGGKLLRKAGWDGNKNTLYEKENGPITLSTKYRSLQRKKNGLGYNHTNHNGLSLLNGYRPMIIGAKRVPFPTACRPSLGSNTMATAIVLDDESEEGDDDVIILEQYEIKQKKKAHKNRSYDKVIAKLKVEREGITKKYILKQFRSKQCAVTKMVVSLIDSYSQCRIGVPVRGKYCNHLQPFDAQCFLLRARKYQKCTQCNQSIKRKDLLRNEYFENIFECIVDENVEQIEIMKDATWKVVAGKGKKEQIKQRKLREKVIVDLSDNEEDEGDICDSDEERDVDIDGNDDNLTDDMGMNSENVIVLSSDDEDEDDDDDDYVNDPRIINQILNKKNKKRIDVGVLDVVDLLDSSDDESC